MTDRHAEYYRANRERLLQRAKEYNQNPENKEKIKAKQKAYYLANKERLSERGKKARKEFKEAKLKAELALVGGNVSSHTGAVAPKNVVREESSLGGVPSGEVLGVPGSVSLPLNSVVRESVVVHPLSPEMRSLLTATIRSLECCHILLISLRRGLDIK